MVMICSPDAARMADSRWLRRCAPRLDMGHHVVRPRQICPHPTPRSNSALPFPRTQPRERHQPGFDGLPEADNAGILSEYSWAAPPAVHPCTASLVALHAQIWRAAPKSPRWSGGTPGCTLLDSNVNFGAGNVANHHFGNGSLPRCPPPLSVRRSGSVLKNPPAVGGGLNVTHGDCIVGVYLSQNQSAGFR
jgi:hypothetical protein